LVYVFVNFLFYLHLIFRSAVDGWLLPHIRLTFSPFSRQRSAPFWCANI